jgi:coenzyme PQQ precursor peptide PqqA
MAARARQITDSETTEILMTTATGLKPSVPKQVPASIQTEAATKWSSPRIVEVAVGLEINSYARAELN